MIWESEEYSTTPNVQPHDPSMTFSDSSILPSVHLLQKWMTVVTQNNFEILCSVMLWTPFQCILVHIGAFWGILVHIMCNPMTPPWLALTPPPFQVSIYSRYGSCKSLRTNSKHLPLSWYCDHFSVFWSILVHFVGDPTTPLYWIFIKSSKTCILRIKSF